MTRKQLEKKIMDHLEVNTSPIGVNVRQLGESLFHGKYTTTEDGAIRDALARLMKAGKCKFHVGLSTWKRV